MTTGQAIDPTFTLSWLDNKLDDLYDIAIGEILNEEKLADGELLLDAYSNVLAYFQYQGLDKQQIQEEMWNSIFEANQKDPDNPVIAAIVQQVE